MLQSKRLQIKPGCFALLIFIFGLQLTSGCSSQSDNEQHKSALVASPTPIFDLVEFCVSQATAALSKTNSEAVWSPDGKKYGIAVRGCGVVVNLEQRQTLSQPIASYASFWGWTADSRFAIFRYHHAHNQAFIYVFDLATTEFKRTSGCSLIQAGSLIAWDACGDYPIALAPNAPYLLLENGNLLKLPDFRQKQFFKSPSSNSTQISLASWSPDGAYLGFVDNWEGILYLARGDGTQLEAITTLEGYAQVLQWATDSLSLMVETHHSHYILDVTSREVHRLPPTSSP